MSRARKVVMDEKAQAIVEFVLIIPVVLFMFFSLMQAVLIVNASQMAQYAAGCAARVLVVQLPHRPADAARLAKNAAALALLPVSPPVRNELLYYAGKHNAYGLVSVQAKSFLKNKLGFSKKFLESLQLTYPLGTGSMNIIGMLGGGDEMTRMFTAWNRLEYDKSNPLKMKYTLRQVDASTPQLTEVYVDLTYDYPLYLPGFSELWSFLSGPALKTIYPEKSLLIPFSFMKIRAKCAMGYEPFEGGISASSSSTDNPYGDQLGSADINRVDELNQEAQKLQPEIEELERKRGECGGNYESEGFDSAQACKDHYNGQLQDKWERLEEINNEIGDNLGGFGL